MPPCDPDRVYIRKGNDFVSILVLMDAALRLFGDPSFPRRDLGFNPCFDGCRPATVFRISPASFVHVSILVLMDAALRLLPFISTPF